MSESSRIDRLAAPWKLAAGRSIESQPREANPMGDFDDLEGKAKEAEDKAGDEGREAQGKFGQGTEKAGDVLDDAEDPRRRRQGSRHRQLTTERTGTRDDVGFRRVGSPPLPVNAVVHHQRPSERLPGRPARCRSAPERALSAVESVHHAQVMATGDGHLRISFQLQEKSREAAEATTHRLIESCADGIGLQPDVVHAIAR